MRISKAEREQNARKFYNAFMNGNSKYSVVVVKRTESKTNPNICRTQFLAVCSSFKENLEVISESTIDGVRGCFIELLTFIKPIKQVTYYDDSFHQWLKENYHFDFNYYDGSAYIFIK